MSEIIENENQDICEDCEDTGVVVMGEHDDLYEEKCHCTFDADADFENERDNNL